MTFSSFHCSFLSDLYCSPSEVKLVANTKLIAAYQKEGTDSRADNASAEVSGGPWFESRCGKLFLHPKKNLSRLQPLN